MKRFAVVNGRMVATAPYANRTYWNGHDVQAAKVSVVVGPCPPGWWCAPLVGTVRQAVRVDTGQGSPFYLDNEDGSGWWKVTKGKGSPRYPHRSLSSAREVTP